MMVNCHICDKLALDRYYNNHLKSQTHIKIFRKRQQCIDKKNSSSFSTTNNAPDFEKIVSFNESHKKSSCYIEISPFCLFIYKFVRPEFE